MMSSSIASNCLTVETTSPIEANVKLDKDNDVSDEEASFHTARPPADSTGGGGASWSRLDLTAEADDEKLIYSDAEDNEEELAAMEQRKRVALRETAEPAPTAKKRSRAWGLTKPSVVPVVITASVLNEMLPANQSKPTATFNDSIDNLVEEVADKVDEAADEPADSEHLSELEDGEVPFSVNSGDNPTASAEVANLMPPAEEKRLPTLLAGLQPSRQEDSGISQTDRLGRLSRFRKTRARPCIFWCPVDAKNRIGELSEALAESLPQPPPPPPPDPYESVFDVAGLEAEAGVRQFQRNQRRLHRQSRPLPTDFQASGGRLVLNDSADGGGGTPAVLHHFPRCLKPYEADELYGELRSVKPALVDGDDATVKFDWIGDNSSWPAALDRLRRQLAALLKAHFDRAAVVRLGRPGRPGDCTDWWHHQSAKPSENARPGPPPLAAMMFLGGPPRPVEFRELRARRGNSRRLHLTAARHGALLVAEGAAVSKWAVRLPALTPVSEVGAETQPPSSSEVLIMVILLRSAKQN